MEGGVYKWNTQMIAIIISNYQIIFFNIYFYLAAQVFSCSM